jgi:hypothetical protein
MLKVILVLTSLMMSGVVSAAGSKSGLVSACKNKVGWQMCSGGVTRTSCGNNYFVSISNSGSKKTIVGYGTGSSVLANTILGARELNADSSCFQGLSDIAANACKGQTQSFCSQTKKITRTCRSSKITAWLSRTEAYNGGVLNLNWMDSNGVSHFKRASASNFWGINSDSSCQIRGTGDQTEGIKSCENILTSADCGTTVINRACNGAFGRAGGYYISTRRNAVSSFDIIISGWGHKSLNEFTVNPSQVGTGLSCFGGNPAGGSRVEAKNDCRNTLTSNDCSAVVLKRACFNSASSGGYTISLLNSGQVILEGWGLKLLRAFGISQKDIGMRCSAKGPSEPAADLIKKPGEVKKINEGSRPQQGFRF